MDTEGRIGQKISLRRNRKHVITENLTHMEQKAHKKKLAQELYYDQNAGKSPLIKNLRPPVHERLGNDKKIRLRRMRPVPNQYYVKPRVRLQREGIFTKKYRTSMGDSGPKFSAQKRLDMLRKSFHNNIPNSNGKIMLRRRRLNNSTNPPLRRPLNLQVEVKNTSILGPAQPLTMHSVKHSVNVQLQEEIRLVQMECKEKQDIPNMPIYMKAFGATNVSLHSRFSNYP